MFCHWPLCSIASFKTYLLLQNHLKTRRESKRPAASTEVFLTPRNVIILGTITTEWVIKIVYHPNTAGMLGLFNGSCIALNDILVFSLCTRDRKLMERALWWRVFLWDHENTEKYLIHFVLVWNWKLWSSGARGGKVRISMKSPWTSVNTIQVKLATSVKDRHLSVLSARKNALPQTWERFESA